MQGPRSRLCRGKPGSRAKAKEFKGNPRAKARGSKLLAETEDDLAAETPLAVGMGVERVQAPNTISVPIDVPDPRDLAGADDRFHPNPVPGIVRLIGVGQADRRAVLGEAEPELVALEALGVEQLPRRRHLGEADVLDLDLRELHGTRFWRGLEAGTPHEVEVHGVARDLDVPGLETPGELRRVDAADADRAPDREDRSEAAGLAELVQVRIGGRVVFHLDVLLCLSVGIIPHGRGLENRFWVTAFSLLLSLIVS